MHVEAYEYIERTLALCESPVPALLELGSREVFGPKVRDLAVASFYWGVDAEAGPGVDEVANAADWSPPGVPNSLAVYAFDVVVCAEVFEHTPRWPEIVANTFRVLRPGGRAIFTCAGPGRPVHGVGTDNPDDPAWYANVVPTELWSTMVRVGFVGVRTELGVNVHGGGGHDTYGTGVKP